MNIPLVFLVLTLFASQLLQGEDTQRWADEEGRMIPIEQLSDDQLNYYRKAMERGDPKKFPSIISGLKRVNKEQQRREKLDIIIPPAKKRPEATSIKIDPRQKPKPNNQQSTSRTSISRYTTNIRSIARSGKIRMNGHRELIELYRSFRALEVIGNLQTIDNLARSNIVLFDKLQEIADVLDRSELSEERLAFYEKSAKELSSTINTNEKRLNLEKSRIIIR